jgi:L-2-hydroxyglutarate oxidase LhgO
LEHVESIVVGAGVVGLAVARRLAMSGREVLVLEAETAIGTGVSSRNSCVIHAGIYYAQDSVKARVCVAGKHALYQLCASHGVSHRRVGKLIVATDAAQLPALDALRDRAVANGVRDLRRLDAHEARALEPEVRCAGALLSPSTGIVDVHEFMEANGAALALATPVLGGAVESGRIVLETGGTESMTLSCDLLVNSAGLGAQALAASLKGLPAQSVPPLHLAKGNYFALARRSPFSRLIYPMPDGAWLGVHATLDLGGRCRFGPDLHWVDTLDYDVDDHALPDFYASVRRWWPGLPDGSLQPDYTGIRPKIYGPGEAAADFRISGPADHGIPGLVNLYGIESPGLTASLAIAEEVSAAVQSSGSSRAVAALR